MSATGTGNRQTALTASISRGRDGGWGGACIHVVEIKFSIVFQYSVNIYIYKWLWLGT
ncbi:hypothetical protein DPMN_081236 [Dreissena polymorpha]|uniref:Uncharacterized protein n=1 Tax=Dreissena polymorpha TaxID=45954 RepID=A0A9D3Y4K2_DREPO|nr:hypothetical protein DPMN_081236 [Dreissena polymorpha]